MYALKGFQYVIMVIIGRTLCQLTGNLFLFKGSIVCCSSLLKLSDHDQGLRYAWNLGIEMASDPVGVETGLNACINLVSSL